MSRSSISSAPQSLVGAALLWICSFAVAQSSLQSPDTLEQIDQHITNTRQLVNELDLVAESCTSTDVDSTQCQDFATMINGDFLPRYLELCNELKTWREQLSEESSNNGVDPAQGPKILQQLLDVEFSCGEEALTKRTQFVLSAWTKIRSPSYQGNGIAMPNQNAVDSLNYSMRNSLLNGVDNQQERVRAETQQLWRRLELENIRQQNRRPIDLGTIIQ